MMAGVRTSGSSSDNVRMGPLALFTLVTVLCLAVLAVLAISTANATNALALRRASATTQLYLDETAAQTFMAVLDEQLAQGSSPAEASQIASEAASAAVSDQVIVTASYSDTTHTASFDAGNGRQLDIQLNVEEDGSLSVQRWRMTTVVNEEPPMGNLYGSSRQEG